MDAYKLFLYLYSGLQKLPQEYPWNSTDWNSLSSGLIGALIGSIVGGFFALAGAWWSHHLEIQRKIKEEKENQVKTLTGVKAELTSLWKLQGASLKSELSQFEEKSELGVGFEINQDFISLYHSLQNEITQINNKELSSNIIDLYLKIKSLLNHLVAAETLHKDYREALVLQGNATTNDSINFNNRNSQAIHIAYKETIKERISPLFNSIELEITSTLEKIDLEIKVLTKN